MSAMLSASSTLRAQPPRLARARSVCTAAAAEPALLPSRRALTASLLAAAPLLLSARPASALLPDDEDVELLAKAKAERKNKLVQDKEQQAAFARATGYASPAELGTAEHERCAAEQLRPGLTPLCRPASVQTAVNALSKTGFMLSSGLLDQAKTTARHVRFSLLAFRPRFLPCP